MNIKKAGISTLFIIVFSLAGRILGFLRDALIALSFGSGIGTDSYFVALTATGIFTVLIWTAINTTLVPILFEIERKEGPAKKQFYINNMITIVFAATFLLTIIGWLTAPYIVRIIAVGFKGSQYQLTVLLTRIGFPKLMLSGSIGILIAFLHSEQKFKSASSIYIFSSITMILYLIVFSDKYGVVGLMMASFVSVFIQLIVLIPESYSNGLRYRPIFDLNDVYLKKMGYLILPVFLGTAVNEINLIVDRTIASSLTSGSISALSYANKLNDLILGVFITAITTVIFPILTKEANKEDKKNMTRIIGHGIELVLIISIPATVGLLVLAEPIVQIAFQRGQFDATATAMTSYALVFYSIGLVSMALRLLLTRVYYSIQDTKSPTINSAIAVVFNIVLNLILVKFLKHGGLALATSISVTIATILMYTNLNKKIGSLETKKYLKTGIKISLISSVMGAVVYITYNGVLNSIKNIYFASLTALLISIIVGIISFCLLSYIFSVGGVRNVVNRLLRKKEKI